MKTKYLILFLTINFFVFGQTYRDAQLWFNLYLEKKISKKVAVHLNQQDRWTYNITRFNLAYADVGLTFKLTKNIKILTDYVFAQKRRNFSSENMWPASFRTVHQFYAALILKKDIHRWRFMYRNMFQVQYVDPYTSAKGYIPLMYDRNKFTLKYEWNKYFIPYIAQELYFPLNIPSVKGVSRSRTFVGLFYNVTKRQQLELYFMFQDRLQKVTWYSEKLSSSYYKSQQFFVYGIGYSFDL
jgi:hypothetical protein